MPIPSATGISCTQLRQAGTLGGIAGMIGTIQAVEAASSPLAKYTARPMAWHRYGKLLLTDARHWDTQTLHIEKRHDCPVCSITPDQIRLPDAKPQQCATAPAAMNLNDLQGLFESGIPFTLLDVREPHEWANGHLEGALHIPLGRLLVAPEVLD